MEFGADRLLRFSGPLIVLAAKTCYNQAGTTGWSAVGRQGIAFQQGGQLGIIHRQGIGDILPSKGARREVHFQMIREEDHPFGIDGGSQPLLYRRVAAGRSGDGLADCSFRLGQKGTTVPAAGPFPVKNRTVPELLALGRVGGLVDGNGKTDRLVAGAVEATDWVTRPASNCSFPCS